MAMIIRVPTLIQKAIVGAKDITHKSFENLGDNLERNNYTGLTHSEFSYFIFISHPFHVCFIASHDN